MRESTPLLNIFVYGVMALGVFLALAPIYFLFASATVDNAQLLRDGLAFWPGTQLIANIKGASEAIDLPRLLTNSLTVAFMVTVGKMFFSSLTAFAVVYFRSPFKHLIFWAVFATLLVPLEVRIIPTYAVAADLFSPLKALWHLIGIGGITIKADLNLLNTYPGLALPLIASATGTFLFRQFFNTLPAELSEAARLDGAGPLRFFFDILLPLSKTNFAALGTLVFVGAWKDYMWPLLVTTNDHMRTIILGVAQFVPPENSSEVAQWNLIMATALIAILPPLIIITVMQRWFVKGLVGGDK